MKRHWSASAVMLLAVGAASLAAAPFIRGDANQDGKHDIADAIATLNHLFSGGATTCRDALDVNDDGAVDVADPVRLLAYLFASGATPPAPFPGCGDDPTADAVACASFNPAVCPVGPTLSITSIAPTTGPAAGGTPVVILGAGFSAGGARAFLCNRSLGSLVVVSDTRLEGTTPAGGYDEVCALRVTAGGESATLLAAFTYEPEPPPPCSTEADLEDLINANLGQPICLPSPAYEGELLGQPVIVCPVGCCTCASTGEPGCEATFKEFDVNVNFPGRDAVATFTAEASLPIKVGSTNCNTEIEGTGGATMDFAVATTKWPGVYQITNLSNLVFTIDDLSVSASGGLICVGLGLAEEELRTQLEAELNARSEEFLDSLREELVGTFVCP